MKDSFISYAGAIVGCQTLHQNVGAFKTRGDMIRFVSSKVRRLETRNLQLFYFYSLYNILKDELYRISKSEFYE